MDFNKGSMESQQIVELLLSMQAKMETNRKAYHEEMMAMINAYHERMMACLRKTKADREKTEPNPGMMQSTEEHQEIPKGEVAVMSVGEPRKWHRVCSLAGECRQKRKKMTQGNRGSRRKSAAACSKVSHCARVAWHKGRSHEGPSFQQERRKTQTRIKFARASRKGRTLGMRQLMHLEGTNGTRNRDFKEQLRLGNERTTS
jgi:hypothetical protein